MYDLRGKVLVTNKVTLDSKTSRIDLQPDGPRRGKHRLRYGVLVLGTYTDQQLAELDLDQVMGELGWVRAEAGQ